MKKIVSMLQPFDANQNVIVYEDGNKLEVTQIPTSEIAEGICKLAISYQLKEINLGGAKQYAKGISKKIKEYAITEYAIEDIEVILI